MNDRPLTEDEILAHMGVLLLNVQQFEFLLKAALKQIYADTKELTADQIFAEDKRTLGMLLTDLRKRALIDHDAEALLVAVLRERNLFVHQLQHQEWFDLATDGGRDRLMDFLGPFTLNLNRTIQLFVAIHVKHGDDVGFDSPAMREIKALEGFQVSDYYPFARKIRKKGAAASQS